VDHAAVLAQPRIANHVVHDRKFAHLFDYGFGLIGLRRNDRL
jgi:hypothetical protein